MATHSSILAWEIPWTEDPGRLQSMGSQRTGYDLVTKQQQQIVLRTKCTANIYIYIYIGDIKCKEKREFWKYLTENQYLNQDIKEVRYN